MLKLSKTPIFLAKIGCRITSPYMLNSSQYTLVIINTRDANEVRSMLVYVNESVQTYPRRS